MIKRSILFGINLFLLINDILRFKFDKTLRQYSRIWLIKIRMEEIFGKNNEKINN